MYRAWTHRQCAADCAVRNLTGEEQSKRLFYANAVRRVGPHSGFEVITNTKRQALIALREFTLSALFLLDAPDGLSNRDSLRAGHQCFHTAEHPAVIAGEVDWPFWKIEIVVGFRKRLE